MKTYRGVEVTCVPEDVVSGQIYAGWLLNSVVKALMRE
jgi:hypothetical protein